MLYHGMLRCGGLCRKNDLVCCFSLDTGLSNMLASKAVGLSCLLEARALPHNCCHSIILV